MRELLKSKFAVLLIYLFASVALSCSKEAYWQQPSNVIISDTLKTLEVEKLGELYSITIIKKLEAQPDSDPDRKFDFTIVKFENPLLVVNNKIRKTEQIKRFNNQNVIYINVVMPDEASDLYGKKGMNGAIIIKHTQ